MKKMLIVFFCFVCVFLYAEENKTAAIGITAGNNTLSVSLEVMACDYLSFVFALGIFGWDAQLMYHFTSGLTGVSAGVFYLARGSMIFSDFNAVGGAIAYAPVNWLRVQFGAGYVTSPEIRDNRWINIIGFLPDRFILYFSTGVSYAF